MINMAPNYNHKRKINFERQVDAVEDYLFSKKGAAEVGGKYGISKTTMRDYWTDKEILEYIARKRRLTYQEILDTRNNKLARRRNKERSFETKVRAVEDYLFTESSTGNVAHNYGIHDSTLIRWYNKENILREVAERKEISYEDILIRKDRKVLLLRDLKRGKNRNKKRRSKHPHKANNSIALETKVNTAEDYIFSDKSINEVRNGFTQTTVYRWFNNKKVLEEIARRRGMRYVDVVRVREEKTEEYSGYPFETKVSAVEAYLFHGRNAIKNVPGAERVSQSRILKWYNNKEILEAIAKRREITYEQVTRIRNSRLKPRYPFESKVIAVESYLFNGDKTTSTRNERINESTVLRWRKNEEVLIEVAKRRGLTLSQVLAIRNEKLKQRTFHRNKNIITTFQEYLETHEEAEQVREVLAVHEELMHYLSPEQQEAVLQAAAQRVYENLNGQKEQFPPEKLVYVMRNLNVGVVTKPDSNGTPPLPEVLGRAYRAQIIGDEMAEEILGRWLSENLQLDRLQTPSEGRKVLELQKELVGVN